MVFPPNVQISDFERSEGFAPSKNHLEAKPHTVEGTNYAEQYRSLECTMNVLHET